MEVEDLHHEVEKQDMGHEFLMKDLLSELRQIVIAKFTKDVLTQAAMTSGQRKRC